MYSYKVFQQKFSLECKTACLFPQDTEPPMMWLSNSGLLVSLRGCRFAGIICPDRLARNIWGCTGNRNLQLAASAGSSLYMKSKPVASQIQPAPVLCNLSGNPRPRPCPIDKIPVCRKVLCVGKCRKMLVLK